MQTKNELKGWIEIIPGNKIKIGDNTFIPTGKTDIEEMNKRKEKLKEHLKLLKELHK